MSSIRPIATIMLLVAVVVFLYTKINESEPPLPEGVEGWSPAPAIEIGSEMTSPPAELEVGPPIGVGAVITSSAPSFATTPGNQAAQAFQPDVADSAPSWSENQTASAPTTPLAPPFAVPATPPTAFPEANTNFASDIPDLPPLPTISPAIQPSIPPSAPPIESNAQTSSGAPSLGSPEFGARSGLNESMIPPDVQGVPETSAQAQSSLFSATRLAVQSALDRGELSQALLLLSDWYGDPSLSPSEASEVEGLLGQLAGSVIYSTEHRLVPPHLVQAGERLEDIAKEYKVPWQLLAKINGIERPDQLQVGQQLKVLRGPFSATINLSQRKFTLMLDRRYAGQFAIEVDPTVSVEEGHWAVNQKLVTPATASLPKAAPSEERTVILKNTTGVTNQVAILRRSGSTLPAAADPAGRVIRLQSSDVEDVFDILSLGSPVTIRR